MKTREACEKKDKKCYTEKNRIRNLKKEKKKNQGGNPR